MDKKKILTDFITKFKELPAQRSKQWLDDRKLSIGGSEMGTIAGYNPYKNLRGLIEGHLGLTTFNGNVNTYWGTILEDQVTVILEKKWNSKIYETGSLPGIIPTQKYSPDGLVYLDEVDKIVLIEIKSAARRIADGKIPRMYKPQIYTGLDTIPIADMGMFVDALFRRCSIADFDFTPKYDTVIHPNKPLGLPLYLCAICIYEDLYSTNYDQIKAAHSKGRTEWIDAGDCSQDDLELLLGNTANRKLRFFMPSTIQWGGKIQDMFEEFREFVNANNYEPIAIMPVKLFRLELIPVERGEWKKKYNRKTKTWDDPENGDDKCFVETYQGTIEDTIAIIKRLDILTPDEQVSELDILYPPEPSMNQLSQKDTDDIINSLLF